MSRDVALGIDLGTTNSCGYIFRNGRAIPVTDSTGSVIIPSCVYYSRDRVLIGESAKKFIGGDSVCINAKRLIGRRWDSEFVQGMLNRCNAAVEQDDLFPVFLVPNLGRKVSPKEVSQEIIKYIIGLAEEQLDKKITHLVVTVPAYFGMDQRNATLDAALDASGLNRDSIFLINEPTAASICYDLPSIDKLQHVLVYDLGGGTFDISLIRIEKKIVTVLNTGGNNMLGGDDFTEIVAGIICQHFQSANDGKDLLPPNNESYKKLYARRYRQLLRLAEDAKIALKNQNQVTVDVGDISQGNNQVVITSSEMERALRSRIQETIDLVHQVLKDSNMEKSKIDRVLLVGGSSKLNMVKRMLIEEFGEDKVSDTLDPDQCVSKGAVLYYKKFGTQIQDKSLKTDQIGSGPKKYVGATLREIVNISLGTRVGKEHRMDIMIPKGTIVPKTISKVYCVPDFQTKVQDALFQGENEFTKDCEEIAPIIIEDITPAPSAQIKLEYTFTVDYGGIVTLLVKELPSKRILFGPKRIEYTKKGN